MGKPHDHPASKLPSSAISKVESTITLKVSIHCEGCRRKVKRIIKCVDGVESVDVEAGNGKVTVVGKGVDVKDVLENLHKAGKHAEVWHFGGGKATQIPQVNQPNNTKPTNNNNNNNNNKSNKGNPINGNANNNTKALGWDKLTLEDNKSLNHKGKGNEGNSNNSSGGNGFGANMKGGEMSNVVPPKPAFPSGGFTHGGHFEAPHLPVNNAAILSRNVAPMPSIYYGETSHGPLETSEYGTADYATHLFNDENANNCSLM